MEKSEVVRFLENYGPNCVADACVLWLLRKHRLYFQPYSQEVVRWLSLAFCKKHLGDAQVTSWLKAKKCDISYYRLITEELWSAYCNPDGDDIESLGVEDIDSIRTVLSETHKYRVSIISIRKNELRLMLKHFFDEVLPMVICAKRNLFEEQTNVESVIRECERRINELKDSQSIEEYVESLFKDYSNSLYNRILTPIESQENVAEQYNAMVKPIINRNSNYRQSHILRRYKTNDDYEKYIGREQKSSNELLCMMTMPQPVTSSSDLSEVVISQLGSYANPIAQLGEALKVFLANNNIILSEIKEKLGIAIELTININFPNSVVPSSAQRQRNSQPVISSDGSLHLPAILDTPKARVAFANAISKRLIMPNPDGSLLWLGIEERSKNSQLAYLCEKIYEGDYDIRGNKGKSMPFQELEALFNVHKMSSTIQQVHDARRVQKWRAAIEQLLE